MGVKIKKNKKEIKRKREWLYVAPIFSRASSNLHAGVPPHSPIKFKIFFAGRVGIGYDE